MSGVPCSREKSSEEVDLMLKLFGADVSTLDHITLYAVVCEIRLVDLVTGIIPSTECLVKWPP